MDPPSDAIGSGPPFEPSATAITLAERGVLAFVDVAPFDGADDVNRLVFDAATRLGARALCTTFLKARAAGQLTPCTLVLLLDDSKVHVELHLLDATSDADFILTLLSSDAWQRNIAVMTDVTDAAGASRYIRERPHKMFRDHQIGVWRMTVTGDHGEAAEPVGVCGLVVRPEFEGVMDVGFALLPTATGRGLATIGAALAIEYGAFVLGQEELAATTRAANTAAQSVLRRVGFPAKATRESEGWGVLQYWYHVPTSSLLQTLLKADNARSAAFETLSKSEQETAVSRTPV
jgi:RimJ/RimL family protein N-acetyltransferase